LSAPYDLQPLDSAKLEELRDLFGDESEVQDLFQEYFQELPARLDSIRAGIAEASCEKIHQAAHALKGSSGSLGASKVQELSRCLEESARAGSLDGADGLLQRLQEELDRLRSWLHDAKLVD